MASSSLHDAWFSRPLRHGRGWPRHPRSFWVIVSCARRSPVSICGPMKRTWMPGTSPGTTTGEARTCAREHYCPFSKVEAFGKQARRLPDQLLLCFLERRLLAGRDCLFGHREQHRDQHVVARHRGEIDDLLIIERLLC